MTIAVNPDTGDVSYLDNEGAWQPAKKAVNPDTKEVMAFDGKDWQKVTTHGHGILSYVDDAVRAIASGITFGYMDTIAAKANSLIGRGTYEKNLERERQRSAEAPAAIRIPGEVAGGVLGAVAAAPEAAAVGAATGLSRLPAVAKVVAGGAAAGGLDASSEGTGLEDRLSKVPKGAAIGAATGGLAAGVGRAVGALRSSTERAVVQLQRAFGRDNVTPESAMAAAKGLASDRPGVATVADVGGENVKGLMERVAQTPGAGRTTIVPFLTERQQGQMARVSKDLTELTGSTRTALQAVNETMTQRAKDAAPAYVAAYDAGDRAIWSPELERLSSSPTVKSAMQGAVRIWQDNAVADGFGAMNPSAVDRGGQITFGKSIPAFPNIQFWDYTKRLLDDKVQSALRAGQNQKARVLTQLTSKLRSDLDKQVPEYAVAREKWAGPSSYLNAVEEGRNILSRTESAEEHAANFNALSEADKQGYREAAVSAIIGKMSSDPAKLADMTKYLRSPAMRQKVLAIMPNDQARQAWQRRLDFETKSSELVGRSLGNSATFRRMQEKEDSQSIAGDLVLSAFMGTPPIGLMKQIIVGGAKRVRDTLNSRTDKELARMLTGKATKQIGIPRRRVLGQSPLIPSASAAGATSGLIQE